MNRLFYFELQSQVKNITPDIHRKIQIPVNIMHIDSLFQPKK